jgi:hypothetical protein
VEILRVNEKYIKEMMIDKVKSDLISMNAFEGFDENNKKIYLDTLHRALETDEEEACITIRKAVASNNPQQQIRVSASIRVVERHTSRYIFYVLVRNLSNNQ